VRYSSLIVWNLVRRPLRTALTGLSVAVTTFIFAALLGLDNGVQTMIASTGKDTVITVFERYKACPPYSRLPAHYEQKISSLDGVVDAMAVRFLLSNCQTTTDLVAVHGVDASKLRRFESIDVDEAAYAAFSTERSAALVGRRIAETYGWRVGDQVALKELRGVSFVIRGIFNAPGSSLESVILVDREYLERTIDEVGVATMFRVLVADPSDIGPVSKAIDEAFENSPAQTRSGPEREFIATIIDDFATMVRFTQLVAYLSLVLLYLVMANAIAITIRDRSWEIGVMRTMGYSRRLMIALICGEGVLLAGVASLIGAAAAAVVMNATGFVISVEGYTIVPAMTLSVWTSCLLAGAILGFFGALPSALKATAAPVVEVIGRGGRA
jgi:putative ABC transport system permease protein